MYKVNNFKIKAMFAFKSIFIVLLFPFSIELNAEENGFKKIEWEALIPPHILAILENPPQEVIDLMNTPETDLPSSGTLEIPKTGNELFDQAMRSTETRSEFDQKNVTLPGFIVPLEFDDKGIITAFFLVPYFGACIHMPPPPPNQIIYATFDKGFQLDSLFMEFNVSGKLKVSITQIETATSAYQLEVEKIEEYQ